MTPEPLRFEAVPWTLRLGGAPFLAASGIFFSGGHFDVWPIFAVGCAIALVRFQVVFDPRTREVWRRFGLIVPLVSLRKRTATQVLLEELVTGPHKHRSRAYHVLVTGDHTHSVSVAKERALGDARAKAELVAKTSGLPLMDIATGAGLRPAHALDQSLRSRIREAGWQPQPLGPPPGRLRVTGMKVTLPKLSVLRRAAWPIGLPLLFVILFGALTVVVALGLNHGGHDPILIAVIGGCTAIALMITLAMGYAHRSRFVRIKTIEVRPNGLVIQGSTFGRPYVRRLPLDAIESVGIGGEERLSGLALDGAQAVVIASDHEVIALGVGLSGTEQAWLAGFVTQAIARV